MLMWWWRRKATAACAKAAFEEVLVSSKDVLFCSIGCGDSCSVGHHLYDVQFCVTGLNVYRIFICDCGEIKRQRLL